jgi:hypothetical protein
MRKQKTEKHINEVTNSFICAAILVLLISSIYLITSCGFTTDGVLIGDTEYIEGPTKYKKLYVGPCSFQINVEADIPADWAHWRNNLHQLVVMPKNLKLARSRYSTWDDLYTGVECSFCTSGLTGMLNVLDSKDNLVPWGCGEERPPINIIRISAKYTDPEGSTPVDQENNAQWEDNPLQTYENEFVPDLISDEKFCDNDPVLLDLDEACEVLVEAGKLEKL